MFRLTLTDQAHAGQAEVRPPVLKSPSKLGTHLLTHCRRDERLSLPSQPGNRSRACGVKARYTTTRPLGFSLDIKLLLKCHLIVVNYGAATSLLCMCRSVLYVKRLGVLGLLVQSTSRSSIHLMDGCRSRHLT
ncbi:hypothetical protein TNCV_644581 [Trichonephila clavipes]|nr:hypothetical protein TNCV_644581 [Trichonephila clavipes]